MRLEWYGNETECTLEAVKVQANKQQEEEDEEKQTGPIYHMNDGNV